MVPRKSVNRKEWRKQQKTKTLKKMAYVPETDLTHKKQNQKLRKLTSAVSSTDILVRTSIMQAEVM